MSDCHDAVALLVEDDSRDAEKEILHIRNLLQEESAQRIVHLEEIDILVVAWQFGFDVVVLESKTVAGEHVEKFVLCHHAALSDAFDELIGQEVVSTKGNIGVVFAIACLDGHRACDAVIVEDARRLHETARRVICLVAHHVAHGGEGNVYVFVVHLL